MGMLVAPLGRTDSPCRIKTKEFITQWCAAAKNMLPHKVVEMLEELNGKTSLEDRVTWVMAEKVRLRELGELKQKGKDIALKEMVGDNELTDYEDEEIGSANE